VTAVSDPDRRRADLVDGRDRRTIARYLRSMPEQQRLAIEVVAIDPHEADRRAVRAELPCARTVVVRFRASPFSVSPATRRCAAAFGRSSRALRAAFAVRVQLGTPKRRGGYSVACRVRYAVPVAAMLASRRSD
jgi:hypothetical protein